MNRSDPFFALARRFPALARACLWLWSRVALALGLDIAEKRSWLIDDLADLVQYRIPVVTKLRNGMSIEVHLTDHVGGAILRSGYYEPGEVSLVQKLLEPGMTFLDIGAHVGQYTLVGSERVGAAGEVHAFEPDPETFRWLCSNVERNDLGNVTTNQLALTAEPGTLQLFESAVNDVGSTSLREPRQFTGRVHDVACVPLDDYLRSHGIERVDLIKMDVEGAEISVLQGAKRILSAPDVPILIVEFEEARQRAFGFSCAALADELGKYGYALFIIEEGHLAPHQPRPGLHSYNVMAIPSERVDQVCASLDA